MAVREARESEMMSTLWGEAKDIGELPGVGPYGRLQSFYCEIARFGY